MTAHKAARSERRAATPPAGRRERLRLRTLILLRWLAIAGQFAALVVVHFVMGFPTPLVECMLLITLSVALNLALVVSRAPQRVIPDWQASLQLAFDVMQLSALLYFTGGVLNPFSLLLIGPVTLAAATLPARHAVLLGALAVAAAFALAVRFQPLPWSGADAFVLPVLYRMGLAVATATGIVFTALYAWHAASEAARMELALQTAEAVLAREQRLSALGGLAAAAAHELGTPLATIAIAAKEMVREAPEGPLREDAELLLAQAQRCRDILRSLSEAPETGDVVHARLGLAQLLEEAAAPHQGGRVRVEWRVAGPAGAPPPTVVRLPEVIHALASLIENAVAFARSEVLIVAGHTASALTIEVRDDGPGFSPDVLGKLGEPYVTSRPGGGEGAAAGGMGLGFFIAKTLLERTGARVEFHNARGGGAVVLARWPRGAIEPEGGPAGATATL